MKNCFFVGFATIPIEGWKDWVVEPAADSRLTDPVKIAESVRKKQEQQAAGLSFLPFLSEISAVSIRDQNGVELPPAAPGDAINELITKNFLKPVYDTFDATAPLLIGFGIRDCLRMTAATTRSLRLNDWWHTATHGKSDYVIDPYSDLFKEDFKSQVPLGKLLQQIGIPPVLAGGDGVDPATAYARWLSFAAEQLSKYLGILKD